MGYENKGNGHNRLIYVKYPPSLGRIKFLNTRVSLRAIQIKMAAWVVTNKQLILQKAHLYVFSLKRTTIFLLSKTIFEVTINNTKNLIVTLFLVDISLRTLYL